MNLFLEKLINFILFKLKRIYHEIIIFNFLNDKKIFSIIYKIITGVQKYRNQVLDQI